jgi:tetratricopeptide (TPR) repeat protein
MRRIFFIIILVISCPRPSIKKIPEYDYLREAQQSYDNHPIYAYTLVKNKVMSPEYKKARATLLIKMYIDQRDYDRAAQLLDSLNWSLDLNPYEMSIILLKTERWQQLSQILEDDVLRGIAYYNLGDYTRAIQHLVNPATPHDYRMLYLARAYYKRDDFENALKVLLSVDFVNSYLFSGYQELLFSVLLNITNFDIIRQEVPKLADESLREFILLKMYETQKDKKNMTPTAWHLIKDYPQSSGAYYALQLIKPKTKADHYIIGKVCYYHNDYNKAIRHFKKSAPTNERNYYLGYIYYEKGLYTQALEYFEKSNWAQAYYYRGRIYENLNQYPDAIVVYDSLYKRYRTSSYAIRGQKRKAFLWEDLGDTLQAVETFLRINEKNTKFRAAMQLFKVGKLDEAQTILAHIDEPEFIYWHMRINERLGEPVESLKYYLIDTYPLSYYSVVRHNSTLFFDTTSLDQWMTQFNEHTVSFNLTDSLHLENAIRYFHINELEYATKELEMIDVSGPMDLLYLSKLCAQYGADKQSIIYGLRLKDRAEQHGIRKLPIELFRLIYPVRYAFQIMDQNMELSLCLAMIWQESLFDPGALSPAQAQGLMQIISPTAKKIARELNISSYSLESADISLKFGCYYFTKLLSDFNSIPLSLAAYNAGPVRVKRWLSRDPNSEIDEFIELIPYNETKNYVKYVLSRQTIYQTVHSL